MSSYSGLMPYQTSLTMSSLNQKLGSQTIGSVAVGTGGGTTPLAWYGLQAGSGVSISESGGDFVIAAASPGANTYLRIDIDSQAAFGFVYIVVGTALVTVTLPTTGAVLGATFSVFGLNSCQGWVLEIPSGQNVYFGQATASVSLASTLPSDGVSLVCVNTSPIEYMVVYVMGNVMIS